jgi:hypothetical protein
MRTITLLSIPVLALALAHCGAPAENGGEPDEDTTRTAQRATSYPLCRWWGQLPVTITQDPMNHLYYDVNPSPTSEAAYQGSDPAPPIALRPTYADSTGSITVLQTALYNRDGALGVRYGTSAHYIVHSPRGTPMCEDWATIPFRATIPNLSPGRAYYIQPMTVNTQAKILPTNLAH